MSNKAGDDSEYIARLEAIVDMKRDFIRFLVEDIAWMVGRLERGASAKNTFTINIIIDGMQQHIRHLGESIEENKRWIRDARKQGGLQHNIVDSDAGRAEPGGRPRDTVHERVAQT